MKANLEVLGLSCLLSVAMIVKDEESNIRRALDSVKDIADEIVVVDTGSVDNTPDIVRKYTDKLYFHPWKDDFSEARNNSLKYVTCEWVLILDADEEISEDFRKQIRDFLKNLPEDVNTVYLPTLSYLDWDFKRTEIASTPRLFRNGTVHYENIVHNQAIYKPKVVNANFLIYHYGYIWTRRLRKQKYERTANLIKKYLQQCKNDQEKLYYLIQLYKIEKTGGKPYQIAETGWQAFQLMKKLTSIPAIGLEFLYVFSIDLANAGLNDLAVQLAQTAIKVVPDYPDPYFSLVNIYAKEQKWEKVIEYYERFKKAVEYASENIEKFGWTIMSFKDIPVADATAMIAYVATENYEKFNEIARDRFAKNEDIPEKMLQFLVEKISEKGIRECLSGLTNLVEFIRKKQLKINMQPIYEKIVEFKLPVKIENVYAKEITPFSYALLKRLSEGRDLLLEFLSSGNLKKLVDDNGVGGLLFVYSMLESDEEKKKFVENFVDNEDYVVQGVAKALLADQFLKEAKFLEAIRLYRNVVQLVPELSKFVKPIVEDLKTKLDPDINGVYEELYNFYVKQKEFLIDFQKYAGDNTSKLHLLSDKDVALYVSAVYTKNEDKAIKLLKRIKNPSRFPMYYYRLAKIYSKVDLEKSLMYHIKAVEENEKLADINSGRFLYTGLYPNITLDWFDKNDEILWAGNISERFTTFGVIHPVRAWMKAKNGLIYSRPYPVDESIKAYESFEKEFYKELPLRVGAFELHEILLNLDWKSVRRAEGMKNFEYIFMDLGIEVSDNSENAVILEDVEKTVELKKLLQGAKRAVVFYHVPNLCDGDDIIWYYPAFRILRTTAQMKKELSSIGYKILTNMIFPNGLRCVVIEQSKK